MANINAEVKERIDVNIEVSAKKWFASASNGEKQEMYDLLIDDGHDEDCDCEECVSLIEEMLQTNYFLKQNVLLALKQFNEKANITAMNDLINNIKDL